MKFPKIPANCFGLAVPTQVKAVDKTMVDSEKVLWFKEPKAVKAKPQEIIATNEDIDTCWLDNAGEPGSDKRIAALAAHYAGGNEVSAFVATDDEMAQEMIYKFAEGSLEDNLTSGEEFTQIIRSLAQNCF